jgi:hypothetical protein
MTESGDLDRLQKRLTWEGARPLAQLSNGLTEALMVRGREIVTWMREMTMERPLVSLWFAFQIGFAAGRWGSRRAKH